MRSPEEQAVATAVIVLMREVVYREMPSHEAVWETLQRNRGPVLDHFAAIGIDVHVDDAQGYAYLLTREAEDGEEPLPRLIRRRTLTFNVSLLLVLLRKRMVEFEARGDEGKLVLTREQIIELLRVFQATSTNDARAIDQVDTTIRRATELGFLRELREQNGAWEVRRIIKAYIDAQTMSDFASRLALYAGTASPAGAPAEDTAGATDD